MFIALLKLSYIGCSQLVACKQLYMGCKRVLGCTSKGPLGALAVEPSQQISTWEVYRPKQVIPRFQGKNCSRLKFHHASTESWERSRWPASNQHPPGDRRQSRTRRRHALGSTWKNDRPKLGPARSTRIPDASANRGFWMFCWDNWGSCFIRCYHVFFGTVIHQKKEIELVSHPENLQD